MEKYAYMTSRRMFRELSNEEMFLCLIKQIKKEFPDKKIKIIAERYLPCEYAFSTKCEMMFDIT